MSPVIGIDLGTTNSVVAYLHNGQSEVIANAEGGKLTPSIVLFRADEPPLVGELAKRQMIAHPEQTVRSVKRLMGRRLGEVAEILPHLMYRVVAAGEEEDVQIAIDGRQISPVEISSLILEKMRLTAADYLGEEVVQAIITVPAYFNDAQRQATKEAARQAGLEPLRIINEPTAAALAYGINREIAQCIAVFDFGGGTFDLSILEIEDDVFEVRSTNGDTQLGGDNIDELLSQWLIERMVEETGVDPSADPMARQRIWEAAERAKCELSTLDNTVISLPFIGANSSGPVHLTSELKRTEFEQLIQPILERLKLPCHRALKDANLNPSQIQAVVLVGGSTRIPAVQVAVREIFGREPVRSVNPDEAVALGAAIQGGIINGDIEEILLLDVTPLSLGIEIAGGLMRVLIPRNSSIPVSVSRRFTTTRDNQDAVLVHVLQGERTQAKENRTLAHLRLSGISSAPAEVPEIEVIFSIDADGILSVSAMDLTSGVQNQIVVQAYSAAATRDVSRAMEEAEAHAAEDRAFVEIAQAKTRAAFLVQSMENFLSESADGISEEDLAQIKETLFKLEVCIHGDDLSGIMEHEENLLEVGSRYSDVFFMHRLGERKG